MHLFGSTPGCHGREYDDRAEMTSHIPDVTVIVIVHNDPRRLSRAVTSVLNQSLRNLEVIISDDHSTDETPLVARRLGELDPRVRYLRLSKNSGGCSAPRNAGIAVARAPHIMFLDSDDELPMHACKSILLTIERTGADFVTGGVTRLFEESGRSRLWYPDLFKDATVIEGIRAAPEYFLDHLCTNKLYRTDFIERHHMRFPEGIHYEDQLFSAQAFTLARSFAVVPWAVYTWRLAAARDNLSISSSRHKILNVVDRVKVARLIDAFLDESSNSDLRPAKDHKFLKHDLRLYLGDLPFRDRGWVEQFNDVITPYLDEIADEASEQLPHEQRICQYLLAQGRIDEAVQCASTLSSPLLAPRHVTRAGDRVYWGRPGPTDEHAAAVLDITDWRLDDQPFASCPVRHEVVALASHGRSLHLALRTYDPGRLLSEGGVGAGGELWLTAAGAPLKISFAYRPAGGGEPDVYDAEIGIDLCDIPLGIKGFKGRSHPTITLERLGLRRSDPLLAPTDLKPLRARLSHHGALITHTVHVGREDRGPGRLELTWARTKALGCAEAVAPRLKPVRRKLHRLRRKVTGPSAKALVYHELLKLPMDDSLVLFEALEGRGYADSPRYLYEELVRRGLPLRAVWSYSGNRDSFPAGVDLVRRGSWRYVGALARAKYWVDSHGFPAAYPKRPETRYLQTWHGQPLKRMGFDAPELRMGTPSTQQRHRDMVARWDALIAPSEEFEKTFVAANEYSGELIRSGMPRNDVLVHWNTPEQRERAARARARLQVPDSRKMLLYAPTFRDNARGSGDSIRVNLQELTEKVGRDWIIVVRPHYYDRFSVPRELGHAVRDGGSFPDINDLMLASDALLTDYSSVMFDYANLGRPILLFTDDYEEYRTGARGTYYELPEITPGPMLDTTADLIEVLRNLDRVRRQWSESYARFQRTFNSRETGQSSKAVVDLFFEGDIR
ncbi:hypothetical protein GCM10010252_61420 [Streptomyces aureoverticillatus]|nr:hypothetical protein GCM10010252_61420 [Streptomyces aureoverticillatus]